MAKRMVAIVLAVLLSIGFVSTYVFYRMELNRNESLARELADVENRISAKKAKDAEIRVEIMNGIGGIEDRRVDEDADAIRDILSIAFTWSSYAEYNEMRKTLMYDYGFDKDSQLLTDIWGYIPVSEEDPSYNYIDQNKLRVEYSSCSLYCIGVTNEVYRYFGEVKWRVLGEAGGSYDMVYAFTMDTSSDGKIADLFVYDVL